MKPIWLLDVDGVMNAVTMPDKVPTGPGMWEDYTKFTCDNGYTITYSPSLVAEMQSMVDENLVEIVWLTTWWDMISELPFPDWHQFRVANDREEFLAPVSWWKFPVAQRLWHPDQKMIWADDDLNFERAAVDWVRSKDNVLGVCPKTLIGLTPKHMRLVREFLTR